MTQFSEEFEAGYAHLKCMFCGQDGTYRLMFKDWETKYSHEPINNLGEWYFCQQHGERIRKGLGLFFADLMAKTEEEVEEEPIKKK